MINSDLSPLANHLLQSTLFGGAVWILTLALKTNRAAVRYWLWFAASVKFLVPFAPLFVIGGQLHWRLAPAVAAAPVSIVMDQISQPFTISSPDAATVAVASSTLMPRVLFGVWLCGFAIGLFYWLRALRRIRAIRRTATPLDLNLPIPVMSCAARMEPGVYGIRKPVLLLPEGITERLRPTQLEAVLIHEIWHVRRRDNLTGAIHMVVELIFWFHPLVWWIRTQLVAERERACDEEVIRTATDPQIYAEGILNVCKFYLESPLACISGVGGADLKQRIAEIMARRLVRNLNFVKKALLAAATLATLGGPMAIGLLHTQTGRAQSKSGAPQLFTSVSIQPDGSDVPSKSTVRTTAGGGIDIQKLDLKAIIALAEDVKPSQITGPDWIKSERYSIVGKVTADGTGKAEPTRTDGELSRERLQTLLAEKFHLKFSRELRDEVVYSMVVAKDGPKLAPSTGRNGGKFRVTGNHAEFTNGSANMKHLASWLSGILDHVVNDRTGLTGNFDLKLEWDGDGTGPGGWKVSELGPALQEQLGLTLNPTTEKVETIVIEHVERPAAN